MTFLTLLITIILFIFLIGLCIGSFLNVVILRALSEESIVLPRSKCPSCNTQLKWYHNIPILSYIFLKGKCAFCKEVISIQYPIIEFITGVMFVAVFIKFGIDENAIFTLAFISIFIVLAATDIKEKVIFDKHAYILIALGLIYNFFNFSHLYVGDKVITLGNFSIGINNSFIASVLGLLLGVAIMEIFARFGYLVAKTRAFGEGDSYIAAGIGAILGWKFLITALAYAFVLQIFLTIPVFIKKLFNDSDYKTITAVFVFFGLILAIKSLDYFYLSYYMVFFGILTLALCIAGFYICKRIFSRLKDKENITYLPFGPAMVLGAIITIFLI